MMRTEDQLWDSIHRTHRLGRFHNVLLTRIESGGTAVGISDVEYVSPTAGGWIELKVCFARKAERKIRLQSDFTVPQFQWLTAHDNPGRKQRSWLMIGLGGDSRWNGFLLLTPLASLILLDGRGLPVPSLAELSGLPGVSRIDTLPELEPFIT